MNYDAAITVFGERMIPPMFLFFYLTKQIDKEMHYNISHAPPPQPKQIISAQYVCVAICERKSNGLQQNTLIARVRVRAQA